ncbi:MAG TPA: hypothetical protein VKV15_24715 [Bryobacteraceae bacterium]|nr:hypothetical protein [Bryobacteraceae bacterium]
MRSLLALAALSTCICYGQASSTITLSNGVHLRITASFGQAALTTEMYPASGDSFYRIFRDASGLAVFAYELAVERASNDTFQLTARPAEMAFAKRFPDIDGGKPTPTLDATQKLPLLHSGERASVGLFKSLATEDPVIDTIEVRLEANEAGATAGARSGLRLAGLRIFINGKEVMAPGPRGAVAGQYVMFYLPGHGGYFFSTEAPAGYANFVKVGTIEGKRVKFTLDNDNFECMADQPILLRSGANSGGGAGSGELWVYHDPNYRPQGNWTLGADTSARAPQEFFAAASDSLRWWLS